MRAGEGAPTGHAVRNLIRGTSARFVEKSRGPDHGEGRRVPRRLSYDVDDLRAQPWKKVGDGSHAQGVIHAEALVQTVKEQRRQDWKELSNRKLREVRELRDTLAAELAALIDQGHPPLLLTKPAHLAIADDRNPATVAEDRERGVRADRQRCNVLERGQLVTVGEDERRQDRDLGLDQTGAAWGLRPDRPADRLRR